MAKPFLVEAPLGTTFLELRCVWHSKSGIECILRVQFELNVGRLQRSLALALEAHIKDAMRLTSALYFGLAILLGCILSRSATWEGPSSARPQSLSQHLRLTRRRHASANAGTAPNAGGALDSSRNQQGGGEVVGFWHIGPANKGLGPKDRSKLVLQQLGELKKLPIFGKVKIRFLNDPDALDATLLATLSSQPNFVPLPIPSRFDKYRETGEKLYEYPTLSAFWSHCHANPQDIVFYFHTKTRPGKRNWWGL